MDDGGRLPELMDATDARTQDQDQDLLSPKDRLSVLLWETSWGIEDGPLELLGIRLKGKGG